MTKRPTLLFVSPQFLFPMDAGGKIRTANILKNLKGGAFESHLVLPATESERRDWAGEIETLADRISFRGASPGGMKARINRIAGFLSPTPVSASEDASAPARAAVATALAEKPDLVVMDYAQAMASAPEDVDAPLLFFAHNVETEVLERHAKVATGAMRFAWVREAKKMRRFEAAASTRADAVITVSERDAAIFLAEFGARAAFAIPTGVDPDFFNYLPPPRDAAPVITFTGSMDWKANQDGLFWFLDEVWPLIAAERPDAAFVAVGKNPPARLEAAARARGANWRFTGFVDDVRNHARGAAYVIPLRVGGGTRIKAFEAMAMGAPVVSTTLGVEGLPVTDGMHFLKSDDAATFARAVLKLLSDSDLRLRLAGAARALVEQRYSHRAAARIFEAHCLAALEFRR